MKYLVNDFSLEYELRGSGKKRLVFLHGLCAKKEFWNALVEKLYPEYEICTIDLLGHGLSSHVAPRNIVKLNTDVLFHFFLSLPSKKTVLIGHSMGGNIVAELSEKVGDAFVLVDAPCLLSKNILKSFHDYGQNLLDANDKPKFIQNWFEGFLSSDCPEEIKEMVMTEAIKKDPVWIAEIMKNYPQSSELKISKPALIVEIYSEEKKSTECSWSSIYQNSEIWKTKGKHYFFLENPKNLLGAMTNFLTTI